MQKRLVVALEVLAKMYEAARAHYTATFTKTDREGNNDYMIQTISGMVGKAESTDAIKSWRFQVEVSGHGEQHIELLEEEGERHRATSEGHFLVPSMIAGALAVAIAAYCAMAKLRKN
ncbi:unnamed protein product [Heterosigma akashiwo]